MKHTLLRNYISLFVGKLGSTHDVVYYLDGYAGPGVYADGTAGSPKLAIEIAELVEDIRDLKCVFVEKNAANVAALEALVASELPDGIVFSGALEDHLDTIIEMSDSHPLLAFIDPFGLGLTFEQLKRLGNRTNSKTDIIMNVSLSALRRVGGQLTSVGGNPTYLKARETNLARMDQFLGGDWWRAIWEEAKATGASNGAQQIASEYAKRCSSIRGGYFIAAAKDRWDGPPAYLLLLLAGHNDAFWNFNEYLSIAHDRLRKEDPQDQLLDVADDFPRVLTTNLTGLLDSRESVVLGESMIEVYGELLGMARGTHLRCVIKKLCRDGKLTTSSLNRNKETVHGGQGDLQHMTLKRT